MAVKVLIVDDASFMRVMLKNILQKHGYEVVGEAGNGQVAFEEYKAKKPDIVTMDITMPEVDGITAVRMIKEYDKSANIIMCSAMGQQSMVIESLKAGAKDFVVKPFVEEKVIDAIKKITGANQ